VNPVALRMCYQVKAAKGQLKHTKVIGMIRLTNRFGTEHVDTNKEELLCVPAKRL
jgi:hypothetical protein